MSEVAPASTPTFHPFRNIGRGVRERPKAAVRKLALMWAHRLCGKFNKDIKLFMVGPQGSGKSRSAIYLGMRVAQENAKILDGDPDKWEKYFPRDLSHVFIGDPAAHADALRNLRKNCIYVLDDAGVSINARNFMTSYNKSLNDIFQTVRTDNCLIIINAPDTFLIDNVPRNIVSHFAEVSEQQHSVGLNFIKIFKMERKFRSGETHYHHYQFGNAQVIRWRFKNIPEDMVEIYEKRRNEATQMIKSKAGMTAEDRKQEAKEQRPKRKNSAQMAMEEEMLDYASVIQPVINNGGSKQDLIEVLMQNGFPKARAKRWVDGKAFWEVFKKTC